MFFSLLFSDKKSFGPPLVKYTKLKRLRNSKIQHQAPEMFVWGGRGGEEVFSANFHLDIYYNSNYSEGIIFYGDQEHNS